jgi:hypothetical protein
MLGHVRRYLAKRSSRLVAPLILAIMQFALLSRAHAQDGTRWRGTIAGVVRDSAGAGLAGVRVAVAKTGIQTVTDDSGTFKLSGLPAGPVALEVRRLGYLAATVTVTLADGESRELALVLAQSAESLAPLEVTDAAVPGKMSAFNARRSRGVGTFITRHEIERRQPSKVSELLRYVNGVYVPQDNSDMREAAVGMRRAAGVTAQSNCVVQLYVDGHYYPGGRVDDFRPVEVEGIEIYRSASEIPAAFRGRDSMCGVIAIWTRDPASIRRN